MRGLYKIVNTSSAFSMLSLLLYLRLPTKFFNKAFNNFAFNIVKVSGFSDKVKNLFTFCFDLAKSKTRNR